MPYRVKNSWSLRYQAKNSLWNGHGTSRKNSSPWNGKNKQKQEAKAKKKEEMGMGLQISVELYLYLTFLCTTINI